MVIEMGDGKVIVSWGMSTGDNLHTITLEGVDDSHTVGDFVGDEGKIVEDSDRNVFLKFKNIESARVVQDQLNEMICQWVRDTKTARVEEDQ